MKRGATLLFYFSLHLRPRPKTFRKSPLKEGVFDGVMVVGGSVPQDYVLSGRKPHCTQSVGPLLSSPLVENFLNAKRPVFVALS